MRPTRRGVAALVVVGLAIGLAWVAGERALNAVAAPLLAALVFAVGYVAVTDDPSAEFAPLPSGTPGEKRTLSLSVEGGSLVTVALSPPAGLSGADVDATVAPPHTIERPVTLARRGIYRLDVPTLRKRDPLGLVERRVSAESSQEFVVYPTVYDVDEQVVTRLLADSAAGERQEFDRLREYVPGDPLRDIHWKSSAKRGDFYVMEFAQTRQSGSVTIAADAEAGFADEMATAVATLATAALDTGLSVGITVPEAAIEPGRGDAHREALRRLLARTGPGTLPGTVHEEADVSLSADRSGTRVTVGDRTEQFDTLVGLAGQHASRPGDGHAVAGQAVTDGGTGGDKR